ncbi:MAG: hypothetical protein LC105_00745 [Chitinophagales bacterium]|nr:hypothetical protein [Chitinophagales bacterium]MCZ2392373.1 hypothetical protein [Chitinophagales bacterium]
MKEHTLILLLFLVISIAIMGLFLVIFQSSKIENETGMQNPKKKRFFFFIILASILLVLLSITIPKSPYFQYADNSPAKVVYIAAQQYVFLSSFQAITLDNINTEAIEVPANEVIEFRVTSLDVNHGFAIYNDKAELVTQTQAMPGYINKLRWKFTEPGKYNILCLEFCGGGHSFMRSSFTVK